MCVSIVTSRLCYTECRLRDVRIARGFSQKQLAFLANVSRQILSDYERGVSFPSVAVANRLACALLCSVADIYPAHCECL